MASAGVLYRNELLSPRRRETLSMRGSGQKKMWEEKRVQGQRGDWELVGSWRVKRQLRRLSAHFIALLSSNPVLTLSPRVNCLNVLLSFPNIDLHFMHFIYTVHIQNI